jgi:hypothetical protein
MLTAVGSQATPNHVIMRGTTDTLLCC